MIDALKDAKGLVLYGPPGAGKTETARALAQQMGGVLVRRKADDLRSTSAFVGVLEEAAGRPAVLFVEGLEGADHVVDALLSEMESLAEWNVLVVAAARRPELLDPALMRGGRFSIQVPVGLPDVADRFSLLKAQSHGLALGDDVDFDALARATPGLASEDLAELVRMAAVNAGGRGSVLVGMADFEKALDLYTLERAKTPVMGAVDRFAAAFHEAGHALASYLLPHAEPIRRFTIVPHGLNARGPLQIARSEDHRIATRAALLDKMALAVAGRAAEELGLGTVRSCTDADVESARRIAREIVSRHVSDGVDAAVEALVAQAYERAKRALSARMPVLDALAAELLDKETLTGDHVRRLL